MLGDIASLATLILFIIYFIGRIISICIEKKISYEKIDLYFSEKDLPKELKIVDEFKCDCSDDILIITPREKAYNWLKIYKCIYDEKRNKLKKTKLLYKMNKIYNDTSVRIDAIVSCCIPSYILEFKRSDFMKGIFKLQYNGKNGVEEEILEWKHTFGSIIYYLFR